jgi:uncharacterized membrane protein
MLPSPLHPAVVHFPIVFMMLLPLAAVGALWAIRRGSTVMRAWAFPVAMAAALAASSWAAVETGESDQERAEDVVGEQALNTHETAAERFLLLSSGVLALTAAGLLRGNVGRAGRALSTIAALGLIIAGYEVGHSGGRLVYGDGTRPGLSGIVTDQTEASEGGPAVRRESGEQDD